MSPPLAQRLHAAVSLAQAGDLFAAEARFAALLAERPGLDVAANLAATLRLQGRPDRAVATLEPWLHGGVAHAIAWNTLGVSLLDLGRDDEAAAALRRACEQDPRNPVPFVNLHGALFDDADLGPARAALERGAERSPHDPALRFHLGVCWGLLAPQAAERHHAALPDDARAWLDSWHHVLQARDRDTRFFGSTAQTLRFAAGRARVEGLVVELGVRFGTTARVLRGATAQTVHGFDTFEGLPEAWHAVPQGAYSTGGAAPDLGPGIDLHAGLFAESLPPFLDQTPGAARLVHVDCDLYGSTVDALEALAPRVVPGTILVFDEYLMNPRWRDDEHAALRDVAWHHGWLFRYAAFSLLSHQAVVEILGAR